MRSVDFADVHAAVQRLRDKVVHPPLVGMDGEPDLLLKPENLQRIGAFKIRGASNAIACLSADQRQAGVVAYSSGNHAAAVAAAAAEAGVSATIVIEDSAPTLKVDRTTALGAEVLLVPAEARECTAERIAADSGATLIAPFDDPVVIAGQGTIGVEIAEAAPEVRRIYVPISGGGLAAGIGIALRELLPAARVIGVEPELAGDTCASWHAGTLTRWPRDRRAQTSADALRGQPSELTFAILRQVLHDVRTVSEREIGDAVRALALRARIVAEPGGAVGVAAYLRERPAGCSVAVVSGGNIDPALLSSLLAEVPEAR
ncbi:MAG: threonine ammonia-lyase [Sciscionella sp.]